MTAADGRARAGLYARLPVLDTDRWWVDLARASCDGRVLELGAGAGRLTEAFAAAGARVTAVEPDPAMLAVLRDRAGEGIEVLAGDAAQLPPLAPFGLVTLATSLLNELPGTAARQAVLDAAARACRPDGRVAIHLLGPWWLAGLTGRVAGRLSPADGAAPIDVTIDTAGFEAWTGRRHATLTYRFPDGARLEDRLDAAVVTGAELERSLALAGLEIEGRWGPTPPGRGPAREDPAWHAVCRVRPASVPHEPLDEGAELGQDRP